MFSFVFLDFQVIID